MLDSETVEWAYRLFLDREPESSEAVEGHLSSSATISDLRQKMLGSDEFRRKNAVVAKATLTGGEPPMDIDIQLSDEALQALFDHIESAWVKLGEEEPHWSVSSGEKFKKRNIAQTVDLFYERGKTVVGHFHAALERNDLSLPSDSTVLDFGSGLCRNSIWLAKDFASVLAFDISRSHLELSEQYLAEQGIENVALHRLTLDTVDALPPVDAVFSVIVLQHNPPPLIAILLDRLLGALKPGGIAYFQVPTYRLGYTFRVDEYLREIEGKADMEMHVLPQHEVFAIAERNACDPVEVMEDSWAGLRPKEVSNTFLLQKRETTRS